MTKCVYFILVFLTLGFLFIPAISAQTTEFTYQGSLRDGGQTPNANYDFEFRLYDAPAGGTQIGGVITRTGVAVSEGIFAVKLNFPGGFPGADRYLEISVRTAGGGGYTVLNPRQKFQSTPYAIQSLNAASSVNAQQLGGVAANQFVVTTDPRMTNARLPMAGSASYVQNSTSMQAGATNFNINGTGTAGVFNSTSQYNIGGQRVLGTTGTGNLFAGISAGIANTSGIDNAFFGSFAGLGNTTGGNNSFFGSSAGESNTTGSDNSFFGQRAGIANTTGFNNAFFGSFSGVINATGQDNSFFGNSSGFSNNGSFNSFFGSRAGHQNTTGGNNSFIGSLAGEQNTLGANNSFVGSSAGQGNTTGTQNTFVGAASGAQNTTGINNSFFGSTAGIANKSHSNSFFGMAAGLGNTFGELNTFVGASAGKSNLVGRYNTIIGADSDVAGDNLHYATVVGANATVSTSNTVVLGRSADTVRIPGSLNVTGAITGVFTVPATSITGILSTANGGTGLSSAGAAGNFLRSNGSIWTSSPIATADVPANSPHYIHNGLTLQTLSNFNISGNGTVGGILTGNSINSLTDYSIAGNRVLTTTGAENIFVGKGTGITGSSNSFFGNNAGTNNVTGSSNTLIGSNSNTAAGNLFFATAIGADVVVGTSNTVMLGRPVDTVRVPGNLNVTGTISGSFTVPAANITGVVAAVNGGTGLSNTGSSGNFLRSTGSGWTSSPLTALDVPSGSSHYIQNGTGTQSPGNFNISGAGTVGGAFSANSVNSATNYSIAGARVFSINGTNNVFAGADTGTSGSSNSFFGDNTGTGNVTGSSNTLIGANANVGSGGLTFATAIGADAIVGTSNTLVLGRAIDTVRVPGNLNVSGSISGAFTVPASNITGVLGVSNGGTGLNASGANGNILRSNGVIWTSSPFSVSDIPAGSSNYIQNSTGTQSPGNFNISGNGTVGGTLSAGTVNSVGNYNIAGNRVFSVTGTANVFAGAGTATTGSSNSFFGNGAGAANVSGSSNTIIGAGANVKTGGLTNSTAIGALASAAQNDSVVLGSISGENGASVTASVGIGTNTPKARLDVTNGNILVGSPGQGIILKSPNGTTCRLMAIDNAGAMTLTAIACP